MRNKKAISKDLVLTLGFIILTVMVLVIGVNLVMPLVKTAPEYIVLDAAKTVNTAIAAPEDVTITINFPEFKKGIDILSIITTATPDFLYIKIDNNKLCMYEFTGELVELTTAEGTLLSCKSFVKDNSLIYKVNKENFFGKIIIEKKGGELIFK